MAARPNTVRTLNYGTTLAETHVERLLGAVSMAEYAIETNKLLTNDEIAAYKEAIALCKKQSALFSKIVDLDIPRNLIPATRRRPGRPSAKELEKIETARKGGKRGTKTAAKPSAPKTTAKVEAAVASSEPKRRGRPPKAAAQNAESSAAAPKRRGRPPKAKQEPSVDSSMLNGAGTASVDA